MVNAERLFDGYFHGDNGLRTGGRGAIKSAASGRRMEAGR